METHGDACKLSKRELRKNRKKQNRAKQTLFRHEGIVTTELPTEVGEVIAPQAQHFAIQTSLNHAQSLIFHEPVEPVEGCL